jgi:hypothetical protein
VLDHHEHIQAAQEHSVHMDEGDGEDRSGLRSENLRSEELSPGRAGPVRVKARGLQNPPYGRGGDWLAEADQLVLNTS